MPSIETSNLSCVSCGCTDDRACPGGCSWVSVDPPLCSACVALGDNEADELALGGDVGIDSGRPASPHVNTFRADQVADDFCPDNVMGMHRPLFVDEHRGYCINCRLEFAA